MKALRQFFQHDSTVDTRRPADTETFYPGRENTCAGNRQLKNAKEARDAVKFFEHVAYTDNLKPQDILAEIKAGTYNIK